MSGKGVGRRGGLDVISLKVPMNLSDVWEEQRDERRATCPLRAESEPRQIKIKTRIPPSGECDVRSSLEQVVLKERKKPKERDHQDTCDESEASEEQEVCKSNGSSANKLRATAENSAATRSSSGEDLSSIHEGNDFQTQSGDRKQWEKETDVFFICTFNMCRVTER